MTGLARFARKKAADVSGSTDSKTNSNNTTTTATAASPAPKFHTENNESEPNTDFSSFDDGRPASSGMSTFDNFANFGGGGGFFTGFGSEEDVMSPTFVVNQTDFDMEAETTIPTTAPTVTGIAAPSSKLPGGIMTREPISNDNNKSSTNDGSEENEVQAASNMVSQGIGPPVTTDKPMNESSLANVGNGTDGHHDQGRAKEALKSMASPGISLFARKRLAQKPQQEMKDTSSNQSHQDPEPICLPKASTSDMGKVTTAVKAYNSMTGQTENNEEDTVSGSSPRKGDSVTLPYEKTAGTNSSESNANLGVESIGRKMTSESNEKLEMSTERIFPGKDDFPREEKREEQPIMPTMESKPARNNTRPSETNSESKEQPVDSRIFPGQPSGGNTSKNAHEQIQKDFNTSKEASLTVVATPKFDSKNSAVQDTVNHKHSFGSASTQNPVTPLQRPMTTRKAINTSTEQDMKTPSNQKLGFETKALDLRNLHNAVTPEQSILPPRKQQKASESKDRSSFHSTTNSFKRIGTTGVASITPPHSNVSKVQTPKESQKTQMGFDELCLGFSSDLRDTTDLLESGEEELLELQVELEHGYSLGLRHLSAMTDLLQSLEDLDSKADAAIAQHTQTGAN